MLVRENHPDRLIARGVPEEFVKLANEKLAAINGAYDKIKKEQGFI
jgi:DnaJ like chaperone protein